MEQNHMIMPGDFIVAGISGGADSVCLFFVLLEIKKEIPFSLAVVHIDHKIRRESGEDAAFVGELCRKQDIPFHLFTADIRAMAREQKISEEEAGREYRYQCFRQVLAQIEETKPYCLPEESNNGKGSCLPEQSNSGKVKRLMDRTDSRKVSCLPEPPQGKIAVAHHQNDRAETMLFNLFRGSGLSGFAGIRPVRDNIIRPLLTVSRKEIETFLAEHRIPFKTDSTNEEDTYARNRIRRHILPQAEAINEKAVKHMADTADYLWEAENYLRKQTELLAANCTVRVPGQVEIDLKKLRSQDILLQKKVFFDALAYLAPGRKDIAATHIAALLRLTEGGGSKDISLPVGLSGHKIYDTIVIKHNDSRNKTDSQGETASRKEANSQGEAANKDEADSQSEVTNKDEANSQGETANKDEANSQAEATNKDEAANQNEANSKDKPTNQNKANSNPNAPAPIPLSEAARLNLPNMGRLKISTFPYQKSKIIPQKAYTKWFDYDKITSSAVFRTRQPGDYLVINSAGNRKTLKEYMINEKIPRPERDRRYVLADASHVIWLPGYRISEHYKVTPQTRTVLEIEIVSREIT